MAQWIRGRLELQSLVELKERASMLVKERGVFRIRRRPNGRLEEFCTKVLMADWESCRLDRTGS